MDISLVIFGTLILAYLGVMLYIANQEDMVRITAAPSADDLGQQIALQQRKTLLRWMLYGVLAMNGMFGILVLQVSLLGDAPNVRSLDIQLPKIQSGAAFVYFLLVAVCTFAGFALVNSPLARARLKRLTGVNSQFSPDSSVHLAAAVLILAFTCVNIGQLVLNGGISGLAQDLQASGVSLLALLFQAALMIVLALLGVGLAIRRSVAATLARLKLRIPTTQDVLWGVAAAVGLFVFQGVMGLVWQLLTTPEVFSQQNAASDQLARSFATLPMAFAVSLLAALSEEILFRGALQPVFGLGITSAFFVVLHTQYTLTPATLILFLVALALGWVRNRVSTSAAIIAHFLYNFIQLFLFIQLLSAS